MIPTSTAQSSQRQTEGPSVKWPGTGLGFFGGWAGFSLWSGLFVVWLAYLTWQVVAYRPASPAAGQKLTLPSRAQLTLAEGIWLVQLENGWETKVLAGLAGIAPPTGEKGGSSQLFISQLKEAIENYQGTSSENPPLGPWLVPIAKNLETLEKPGEKLEQGGKFQWKVAPIPPDPMRMRGGLGGVYPDTPFNRSLILDWWSKGEKKKTD